MAFKPLFEDSSLEVTDTTATTCAGMTGTSTGMTDPQKLRAYKLFKYYGITELHHGDCIGADEQCHRIAVRMKMKIVIHPPTDDKKRAHCKLGHPIILKPKPYLVRNKDIVDSSYLMFAFPKEEKEQLRSGTWATIRYAKKQNKPLIIVFPDGTGKKFNCKNLD
jgi:hypothetical protein